jgi:hypothetical protein
MTLQDLQNQISKLKSVALNAIQSRVQPIQQPMEQLASLASKIDPAVQQMGNWVGSRFVKGVESLQQQTPGQLGMTLGLSAGTANLPKAGALKSIGKAVTPAIESAGKSLKASVADLVQTHPILNVKRDIPIKDIYGTKKVIPQGEALTPYELKGNKVVLKDGDTYIVNKNQFQNIKGQSVKAEAVPFAPELKGTTETVKGLTPAERFRGETGSGTKFEQYTLPGGKNYKEILIQAPEKPGRILIDQEKFMTNEIATREAKIKSYENSKQYTYALDRYGFSKKGLADQIRSDKKVVVDLKLKLDTLRNSPEYKSITDFIPQNDFTSSHYPEDKNLLAHVRMNWRDYKKPNDVAFMEEAQSDWAREARGKGDMVTELPQGTKEFKNGNVYSVKLPDYDFQFNAKTPEEAKKLALNELNQGKTPSHPLLKDWQTLAAKRALKEAVDSGADHFSWTTGEQQAARYNLAKQVDNIQWQSAVGGKKFITIKPKGDVMTIALDIDSNGNVLKTQSPYNTYANWEGKNINEVIGKGVTEKIMASGSGKLEGEGLNIGGEWAKNLYDKQFKDIVEKLTGGKVEYKDLGLPVEQPMKRELRYEAPNGGWSELTNDKIKVGNLISEKSIGGLNEYIITDILGDGKFKAVPKEGLVVFPSKITKSFTDKIPSNFKETFDISIPKSTQQPIITLTPEIKARIRGEAPKLKQPSGKSPFDTPEAKKQAVLKAMERKVGKTAPLAQEARKYKSAEDFEKAFLGEIKHGEYWHITDNPNFKVNAELGPKDMSSLASGKMEKGKLMVTSDLGNWADQYPSRKFAVKLDFSNVKPEDYYQVNRGFGNEFYVKDPSKVKVIKVVPIEQALKESEQYSDLLRKKITSKSQLTDIWKQANKQ